MQGLSPTCDSLHSKCPGGPRRPRKLLGLLCSVCHLCFGEQMEMRGSDRVLQHRSDGSTHTKFKDLKQVIGGAKKGLPSAEPI